MYGTVVTIFTAQLVAVLVIKVSQWRPLAGSPDIISLLNCADLFHERTLVSCPVRARPHNASLFRDTSGYIRDLLNMGKHTFVA